MTDGDRGVISLSRPPSAAFTATSGPTHTRLLVVDDHALVRAGLCQLLDDEHDFEVVAAVADAEAAVVAEADGVVRNGTWERSCPKRSAGGRVSDLSCRPTDRSAPR